MVSLPLIFVFARGLAKIAQKANLTKPSMQCAFVHDRVFVTAQQPPGFLAALAKSNECANAILKKNQTALLWTPAISALKSIQGVMLPL